MSGRRGYLTRKHSYGTNNTLNNGGANNCMTYNSTMGRISEAEVHIALMPDMADETIPDEKSTNDALLKLKALPESMAQKRSRKAKLGVNLLSELATSHKLYLLICMCIVLIGRPSLNAASAVGIE